MREFHVMLLAQSLAGGKSSKSDSHLVQVAELGPQTPDKYNI